MLSCALCKARSSMKAGNLQNKEKTMAKVDIISGFLGAGKRHS